MRWDDGREGEERRRERETEGKQGQWSSNEYRANEEKWHDSEIKMFTMRRCGHKSYTSDAYWGTDMLVFWCFSEIEFRCFFSPIQSYNDINKADWTENWPKGGGGFKRKEAVNRPTGACKQIPSRHCAAGTCAKVAVTKLLRGDLRTHAIATCSGCCRTRLFYMRSAWLSHCSMDEGRGFLTVFCLTSSCAGNAWHGF